MIVMTAPVTLKTKIRPSCSTTAALLYEEPILTAKTPTHMNKERTNKIEQKDALLVNKREDRLTIQWIDGPVSIVGLYRFTISQFLVCTKLMHCNIHAYEPHYVAITTSNEMNKLTNLNPILIFLASCRATIDLLTYHRLSDQTPLVSSCLE